MKRFDLSSFADELLTGEDIIFDLDGTLLEGDIGETLFYHTLLMHPFCDPHDEKWFQPIQAHEADNLIHVSDQNAELLDDYRAHLARGEFEKAYTSTARWLEQFERADVERLVQAVLRQPTDLVSISCALETNKRHRQISIRYGAHVKMGMQTMVRSFQEQGATVWIVSASPQAICEIAGERIGIPPERVLGVKIATEETECPRLPWGAMKVRVLQTAGVLRPLMAFGDGEGDIEMLGIAQYPVVIENGSIKLLQLARKNDWWIYPEREN